MLFQKKATKGIVADEGGGAVEEDSSIPVAKAKKPLKKKKKKGKKVKAHDHGKNKGKIAEMLKGKYAGKDTNFPGGGAPANSFAGGNAGKASQFVPIAPQSLKFGV